MAKQQSLPLDQRFLLHVANAEERKENGIQDQKKARQDDVHSDIKVVLDPSARQTSQRPERSGRREGRGTSGLDLQSMMPQASRSAPLPTPPMSPVSSQSQTDGKLSVAEVTQETARLRACLQSHQSEIHSLTIQLQDAQNEIHSLRDERREASKEHLSAIRKDQEEQIEKWKRKEGRLVEVLEEKEQFINGLEKKLDEGSERERDLKKRLAEVETRAEKSEQRLWEAENCSSGQAKPGPEIKKAVQKAGGARLLKSGFMRPRGSSETPAGTFCRIVAQGPRIEKGTAV